jgi:hypothetical protein
MVFKLPVKVLYSSKRCSHSSVSQQVAVNAPFYQVIIQADKVKSTIMIYPAFSDHFFERLISLAGSWKPA